MKKLFLDSANLEDIRDAIRCGVVSGITTNPSLLAKEEVGDDGASGFDLYVRHLQRIVRVIEEHSLIDIMPLSVEVVTTDPSQMLEQAHYLRSFCSSNKIELFIKIPFMFETVRTIGEVRGAGFRVNATAIMTALQAKAAAEAGATVVSFFYRRMVDGWQLIEEDEQDARIRAIDEISTYNEHFRKLDRPGKTALGYFEKTDVPIICGSIREPYDIQDCWINGADIVTAPMRVIREMVFHPKTDEAIKKFQQDIESWMNPSVS
jgi:transaldolase